MAEQLDELVVIQKVLSMLRELDADARERVFSTVASYFAPRDTQPVTRWKSPVVERGSDAETHGESTGPFSENRALSPKQFLHVKAPRTDVERVACLAYYLTHYREQPQFKTLDVSKLNTEAAQVKFSNPAFATANALKLGYLAEAGKGFRQLSAAGERFVQALPDREAAKEAMDTARPRRQRSRKSK